MSHLTHKLDSCDEFTNKRQRLDIESQYKTVTTPINRQSTPDHFRLNTIDMSSTDFQSNNSSLSSSTMHTPIHSGSYTPLTESNSRDSQLDQQQKSSHHENIKLIDESHFQDYIKQQKISISDNLENECPCGHLHGAGQGYHYDVGAVGFADFPLLRGPD
ncbi:uncharacterized protein KGF55_003998 [Candida pseudojiufengensis]|uniref:uncharacterized protein n=1 Tax=Candida pseudojiufengensis TaxID=497109 RepID=UPI002224C1AA|nr:uncharacterized protein KGF55_003998 [Candida pseudojiufengensis]KAI5961375.1 hypothetical protein KGF55_003998 [Candida pseudojiufengensis]